MDQSAHTPENTLDLGHLGKYHLKQKLGKGGFGVVYMAYDPDLEIYRAIKIPSLQDGNTDEFLKEARLQVQINHTNLVQVHSVEQFDGRWAIVMEYLDGGSLKDRLSHSHTIPLQDALHYASCIASGLMAAHAKNILHHDIKPANILFDSHGIPKVADFGIARIFNETNKEMSRVMGTVTYMSPEQLMGIADPRSDIWSLGVILYEMLSGRHCFQGTTQLDIMNNINKDKPVSLQTIDASIPIEVDHLVMRMIEKDPRLRFQTMAEVIKEIEACQTGILTDTEKMPLKKPWPFRRALVIAFIATLFVILVQQVYIRSYQKPLPKPVPQNSTPDREHKLAAPLRTPVPESAILPKPETKPAKLVSQQAPSDVYSKSPSKTPQKKIQNTMKQRLTPLVGGKKAVVKSAFVEIRTLPPGSRIYIDGEPRGTSPLRLMLACGTHTINISSSGYQKIEKRITVEELMEYPIEFTLQPEGVAE